MKRFLLGCGLLLLAVAAGSCTKFGVFQDVGGDPHPPLIEILGVAYTPVIPTEVPTTEPSTGTTTTSATTTTTPEAPVAPPPDFKPADGFEIPINDELRTSLIIRVRFRDPGGDIVTFSLTDRDSAFLGTATPQAPEVDINGDGIPDPVATPDYFTGTSGIVDLLDIAYAPSMLGAHRMELWAEDSHGSRSPKVSFTLNAVLATR